MSWSIVARNPEAGLFGIALAAGSFAVGALCPWVEAKIGVLSTQATMNPLFGLCGLALLREGAAPPTLAPGASIGRTSARTRRAARTPDKFIKPGANRIHYRADL